MTELAELTLEQVFGILEPNRPEHKKEDDGVVYSWRRRRAVRVVDRGVPIPIRSSTSSRKSARSPHVQLEAPPNIQELEQVAKRIARGLVEDVMRREGVRQALVEDVRRIEDSNMYIVQVSHLGKTRSVGFHQEELVQEQGSAVRKAVRFAASLESGK